MNGCTTHTFVGLDGESEVEEIGGVGEIGLHCRWQVKLGKVCNKPDEIDDTRWIALSYLSAL